MMSRLLQQTRDEDKEGFFLLVQMLIILTELKGPISLHLLLRAFICFGTVKVKADEAVQ